MKNIKIIVAIVIAITSLSVYAQGEVKKKETTEFKVEGVCGMCKTRIESAMDTKGVKFAEWNKETKMLKVVYSPIKITIEDIYQKIADIGHDTEKVKAKTEVYSKLPGCCQYKTKETH